MVTFDEHVCAAGREVGPGRWVVAVGDVVPDAPAALAKVRVEIGRIGGVPVFESLADPTPRPARFWRDLAEQLDELLARLPCPERLSLVAHVVRTLPCHPMREAFAERIDRAVRAAAARAAA